MVEYKVACPQCHSALKSGKPIPAGMKLKCPRCGTLFSAPHTATNGPHNGARAAATMGAATAVMAGIPVATAAPAGALTATPPPRAIGLPAGPHPNGPALAPRPAGPPSKVKMLLYMVGGGLLLIGAAVGLVMLCFSGSKPTSPESADIDDPPIVLKVAKKPAPPPPLVSLSPEDQKKADESVKKAVAFLQGRQLANGTWGGSPPLGITSFAGLTLLEAGVKDTDPPVAKAAKFVRDTAATWQSAHETYELSLAILFLDRLNDPRDKEVIRKLVLRLVAAQLPSGGWHYRAPPLTPEEHTQLYSALVDLKTKTPEAVRDMPGHVALSPKVKNLAVLQPDKNRPPNFFRHGGDNSNTQFAILAMLAARKHEVPLDRCLSLIVKRFRNSQNPDGRWTYNGQGEVSHLNGQPLPTMTCAGLLGVAVRFGLDEEKHQGRPEDDPIIKKALEHLSKTVGKQKGEAQHMYFLWSVERVAVLYQLKTINGKEWYQWGAKNLLTHQRADGAWKGHGHGSTDILDTCFGILFLQRANLAQELTDKLEELRAAQPLAVQGPARKD